MIAFLSRLKKAYRVRTSSQNSEQHPHRRFLDLEMLLATTTPKATSHITSQQLFLHLPASRAQRKLGFFEL